MTRLLAAFALALALGACVTPVRGPSASVGGGIPSSPISYGDWRQASASATAEFFQHEIVSRYPVGLSLATINGDLRHNEFNCLGNPDSSGRGDPPDMICRKTVVLEGCTHTWQVHLFDVEGNGQLARARTLYDRRCGGDNLLGGPG